MDQILNRLQKDEKEKKKKMQVSCNKLAVSSDFPAWLSSGVLAIHLYSDIRRANSRPACK